MKQIPDLILVNGSYFRMEKQIEQNQRLELLSDTGNILDSFESVCDVNGHIFNIFPEQDIYPINSKDDLFKFCICCNSLIRFWRYSSDMVDAIRRTKEGDN